MKPKLNIILAFLSPIIFACTSSKNDDSAVENQAAETSNKHKWNYIGGALETVTYQTDTEFSMYFPSVSN